MLDTDQLEKLKAAFPAEALKPDNSRGFTLTSIKAAFVVERLNDVFGPCGVGWRYAHSPFIIEADTEIVTEVALQYRFIEAEGLVGCGRVVWSNEKADWQYHTPRSNWSEPIFCCGGRRASKGNAKITDARKSAVTDGLTKAASMLGIGHRVFKGLMAPKSSNKAAARPQGGNGKRKPSKMDGSTAFWSTYHTEGSAVGISMTEVEAMVDLEDWPSSLEKLNAAIAMYEENVAEAMESFVSS